jgi:threonylcarbamoyladenosine tRNA methylthiotransferase CDKAL1
MKIYFETYGCTLNRADTDIMKGLLMERGDKITENESEADVIVVNTCTVKGPTENKIIERLRTLNGKQVVVAGCLSINRKRVHTAVPGAPLVWPSAVSRIADAVDAAVEGLPAEFKELKRPETKSRFYTAPILRVPVSEGCTGNCHFCQTKLARPVLVSYSEKTIAEWISEGVHRGAREVQLTSMDTGAYGIDRGTNLIELLKCVNGIDGDFFVRVGMINPEHALTMRDELVGIMKNGKLFRFLHVPVQSGSEKVCREMGRRHTVKDFKDVVSVFRKEMPDITIATDIIVGYPTETEEDFNETIRLLEETKPGVVNLSKFTPRPGTKAAEMKQLPTETIKERSRKMSEIIKRICTENNRKYIGKILDVLVTEKGKGRAKNYKQVALERNAELGSWIKVKIKEVNHGSLFAQ